MNSKKVVRSMPPVLAAAFLLILLVFGGVTASRMFNAPMSQPLKIDISQPEQVAKPVAQQVTLKTQSAGVCGLEGSMHLLFVGADFSGGVPPLGADSVRLIHYDFNKQTIRVVSFPRDLWVETDALKDINRKHERLGLSYHYMKEVTTGGDKEKINAGTSLLAQVLYDNFQVRPDHYLTIQLDSIQTMVDTIGGVEINLPEKITTERGVTFDAGKQSLDGQLSTEFLRAQKPGGDPARLKRQNLYINALRTKVLDTGMISKFPALLTQFSDAIVTDLSPSQLSDLACAMEKIPHEGIKFYEIGGDMVTEQKDGTLIPVWGKIKPMLEEALDGKLK